jgi:hypothetical protein
MQRSSQRRLEFTGSKQQAGKVTLKLVAYEHRSPP